MTARIRFFARFRELLGTDIVVAVPKNKGLSDLVKDVASRNKEGYDAIFDEKGAFREFVILMQNGRRLETSDAPEIKVADGDEIAVFPPVAGG
jgi:molybdopterin synthase sulfur carrier subunit